MADDRFHTLPKGKNTIIICFVVTNSIKGI